MADKNLLFSVLFEMVDRLSPKIPAIVGGFDNLTEHVKSTMEAFGAIGEKMIGFGENMAVAGALGTEGAERIHEWSEAVQEPAIAMERVMATMAAMTGLAGDQLEVIKRRAVDFASVHPGVTAEEWISGFTQMQEVFHNVAKAMKAEDIAAMLGRLGIQAESATKLIEVSWSNLRTDAAMTGDELIKSVQLYGIASNQVDQFATATGRLGASAAAAHASLAEVFALSGEAQQLLGGGRGAMMFASMIQSLELAASKGKVNIDFSHGILAGLEQLNSLLSGTNIDKIGELQKMGVGNPAEMLKLLENLGQVVSKQQQIANSTGVLNTAYGKAVANMSDATQRLQQNWSNLGDAFSTPALGFETRATNILSDAVAGLSKHIEKHSAIAGAAAISLGVLGGATYHALSAMSALGSMFIFAGYGMTAIKTIIPAVVTGLSAFSTTAMTMQSTLGGVISLTNLWAAAQWAVNAAFVATPIGWFVLGAAAIGVAAYEIVKHWSAVAGFFEKLWTDVKMVFTDAVDWMKNAGINMVKALGEGILSAIEYPVKAAEALADKIGGYFKFHSPPAYGPLREAVLNFRFGEELAKHIKWAPVIAASTTLAAGIAAFPIVAMAERAAPAVAPMMAMIERAAPVVFETGMERRPARSAEGRRASATAAASDRAVFNITLTYNVTANSGADFEQSARKHADTLVRVIEDKLNRRNRLKFD